MGPTQSPASRMFSAFERILGGRLRTVKYTGHKLNGDDLESSTPSVDMDRARFSRVEKKRSLALIGRRADPSLTSPTMDSFCVLSAGHHRLSQ